MGASLLLQAACGPAAPPPAETGTSGDSDTAVDSATPPCAPTVDCEEGICWVQICEGAFNMGAVAGSSEDQSPLHTVEIETFEVMQTEITVEMYRHCTEAGACVPQESAPLCDALAEDQPRTCLDWWRAEAFCTWAGGRLLSEAEFEFVARSRGEDVRYPWGDDEPSCTFARLGCGACDTSDTAPVCSHPTGDTAQGVCDMAGNAIEWTADWYHGSYAGAPTDGSAWLVPEGTHRVMRGGGVGSCLGPETRARTLHEPDFWYAGSSARCARDPAVP